MCGGCTGGIHLRGHTGPPANRPQSTASPWRIGAGRACSTLQTEPPLGAWKPHMPPAHSQHTVSTSAAHHQPAPICGAKYRFMFTLHDTHGRTDPQPSNSCTSEREREREREEVFCHVYAAADVRTYPGQQMPRRSLCFLRRFLPMAFQCSMACQMPVPAHRYRMPESTHNTQMPTSATRTQCPGCHLHR